MELHGTPVGDARHMLRFRDYRPSPPFQNIEGRRTSMPFLLNYTNPATNCISAYYRKTQDLENSLVLQDNGASDVVCFDGWTQAFEDTFLFGNPEEQWLDDIIDAQPATYGGLPLDKDADHIQAVTRQVARDLAALCRPPGRQTREQRMYDKEAFISLFNPKNVADFCELYFVCWSPHCPILHRSTFDVAKVHPPLLLAVFLIGQAYSSELDASMAQAYYDLAEDYAFNHPEFKALLQNDSLSWRPPSTSLEPLQAAYLMVLVQMCTNNTVSRRRARSSRYNDVIWAARALKLFDSKNEYLDLEQRECVEFEWRGFVAKESRIRLAYLIFGIESNFAMFHSHYPRLAISEMTGDPMCSESCFSATTSVACEQHTRKEMRANALSLSACVSELLESQPDTWAKSRLVELSPMNLFFVLCGLHCTIHASRANGTGRILYPAMMRALDRWIGTWKSQISNFPAEERKKIGFMKDAGPEFWQLAYMFVEAENRGLLNTELLRSMDEDKMESVCRLLETFCQDS